MELCQWFPRRWCLCQYRKKNYLKSKLHGTCTENWRVSLTSWKLKYVRYAEADDKVMHSHAHCTDTPQVDIGIWYHHHQVWTYVFRAMFAPTIIPIDRNIFAIYSAKCRCCRAHLRWHNTSGSYSYPTISDFILLLEIETIGKCVWLCGCYVLLLPLHEHTTYVVCNLRVWIGINIVLLDRTYTLLCLYLCSLHKPYEWMEWNMG